MAVFTTSVNREATLTCLVFEFPYLGEKWSQHETKSTRMKCDKYNPSKTSTLSKAAACKYSLISCWLRNLTGEARVLAENTLTPSSRYVGERFSDLKASVLKTTKPWWAPFLLLRKGSYKRREHNFSLSCI